MATRGWILVCVFGVGSVDVSNLRDVEHEGIVISVFSGVSGDVSVYVRVVCDCGWVS